MERGRGWKGEKGRVGETTCLNFPPAIASASNTTLVRWSLRVRELGSIPSASARQLLSDLGRRETSYLFQRFSVLIQCFNAVLLHDSLPDHDCTDY